MIDEVDDDDLDDENDVDDDDDDLGDENDDDDDLFGGFFSRGHTVSFPVVALQALSVRTLAP
eukprot:10237529-Lingulodinium_polyedra.AAC.1